MLILSDKLHRRALKQTTMNDDPIRDSCPTDASDWGYCSKQYRG